MKSRNAESAISTLQRGGGVYVAFSGGKDSTIVATLVHDLFPDVPLVFCNTGLEFPEIQAFSRAQKGVIEIRPELKFTDVIRNYGYPIGSKWISRTIEIAKRTGNKNPNSHVSSWKCATGTATHTNGNKSRFNIPERFRFLMNCDFNVSARCCGFQKKEPMKKYGDETQRYPIIGTTAFESSLRANNWVANGCNILEGEHIQSRPISLFTEQDVLQFVKQNKIEICSVYGSMVEDSEGRLRLSGEQRTGCIYCAFGEHLDRINSFQRMYYSHPKQWNYCINGGAFDSDGKWKPTKEGLGFGYVLQQCGIKFRPDDADQMKFKF